MQENIHDMQELHRILMTVTLTATWVLVTDESDEKHLL